MQVRYIDTFSSIFRENWVSVDEPIYQRKKIAVFHYQIYDDMKNRAYYKSDSTFNKQHFTAVKMFTSEIWFCCADIAGQH